MDLSVQPREITGKKVRAMRREGLVPAELYGHGLKNIHLSVGVKELNKALKAAGTTTVVNLVVAGAAGKVGAGGADGAKKHPALIHDVSHNYFTGEIEHVDFYEVRMDEKITAKVPLEFTGEAPAVKTHGAIVNKSMAEIEVEALPANLPHSIIVDLSTLTELNQSIYVRDLVAPKGVEILVDAENAIATATPPVEEEVVAPPVDVADIKVESEEKKAERAAEKSEKEEK